MKKTRCSRQAAGAGAVLLAGLKSSCGDLEAPVSKGKTYQISKKIVEGFQKKNGSTVCKDLKGVETGERLRSCDGCIEDGIRILGEYLLDD